MLPERDVGSKEPGGAGTFCTVHSRRVICIWFSLDPPVSPAEEDSVAYNQFLKWKEKKLPSEEFDLDTAHSFCQWQCCLQMGLYLNQLLSAPLAEPDLSR